MSSQKRFLLACLSCHCKGTFQIVCVDEDTHWALSQLTLDDMRSGLENLLLRLLHSSQISCDQANNRDRHHFFDAALLMQRYEPPRL